MPLEKWSDSIVVIHVADDPQFSEDLEAAENIKNPVRGVVLNFDTVRVVNSSNISALLRVRQQYIRDSVKLILCNVRNTVWGTFLVTGLDQIFQFSDNVPTALATLKMSESPR